MIILLLAGQALATEYTLLHGGSTWSYLDSGVAPASDWMDPSYDDSGWSTGSAPLGYANNNISTTVSYGPDSNNKHITTWFRTDFTATGTASFHSLVLSLRLDDGAVVYLNGTEVARRNLPAGAITSSTRASTPIAGSDEDAYDDVHLPVSELVEGTNTLAIEVHQSSSTSSDIVMDAELRASDTFVATNIVRGPYLQQTSDDGTIIRWRTELPTDSVVWYGSSPGNLTQQATNPTVTTEHEVRLTGLGPSTTWTYAVGSTNEGMLAGDDSAHQFTTHPTPGTRQPVRIWALGDAGTANSDQEDVRDAFVSFNGGPAPDVLLMLGDNAYETGTDHEYQEAVFDMYADTLRQVAAYSTLGNHDGYSASSSTQTGPYYDNFTLPTAGEAGGAPSGTEAYYSFDYGNIHFICLDSYDSDRSVNGPMLQWLQSDLAQTNADWVIAFWHHPPYTKGSHDSDNEWELIQMRENALPILEDFGVDLVLAGHSHSYERSYLIDGHHGYSWDFNNSHKVDGSSGSRADGTPYHKPTVGPGPNEGTVHVVAGSAGKTSGGSLDHPVMYASLNELGSLVIDVDGTRLDAWFVRDNGSIRDQFSIDKGDGPPTIASFTPPTPVEGDVVTLSTTGTDADGDPSDLTWDFGDGTTAAGNTVTHAWADDGEYTVTVTAEDDDGVTARLEVTVTVTNAPPEIVSTVVPTLVEAGVPTTLTAVVQDPGTADVITTSWSLGDGAVLEGAEVIHTWESEGTYTVELTATDDDGASAAPATFQVEVVGELDGVPGDTDTDTDTDTDEPGPGPGPGPGDTGDQPADTDEPGSYVPIGCSTAGPSPWLGLLALFGFVPLLRRRRDA